MRDVENTCCWMFTGQGSQWAGMAAQLAQVSLVAKQRLDFAETSFREYRGQSLLAAINSDGSEVDQTGITQPALYAIECALVDHWREIMGDPVAVIGHSVGEYAAAYAAGVFSFEEGMKLIEARGRLMQALPSGGKMLAVKAAAADVRESLNMSSDIEPVNFAIAAVNAPKQTVLSGSGDAIDDAAIILKEKGFRSRALIVSHAFHSPLMAPMIETFSTLANQIQFQEPNIPFYSSLLAARSEGDLATPDYWIRHVSEAVLFNDALRCLNAEIRPSVYLEIGPTPILTGLAKRCLAEVDSLMCLASMSKKESVSVTLDLALQAIDAS